MTDNKNLLIKTIENKFKKFELVFIDSDNKIIDKIKTKKNKLLIVVKTDNNENYYCSIFYKKQHVKTIEQKDYSFNDFLNQFNEIDLKKYDDFYNFLTYSFMKNILFYRIIAKNEIELFVDVNKKQSKQDLFLFQTYILSSFEKITFNCYRELNYIFYPITEKQDIFGFCFNY